MKEKTSEQPLDRNALQPLHLQFESILREKIRNKHWVIGEKIPSENALAAQYGLSRMTIRSVLNRLATEGLLHKVPGKGTYVAAEKILSRPLSQIGIREQLEGMGYSTTTILLDFAQEAADAWMASRLQISIGSPVYVVRRLRHKDGRPFSIHVSCIPQAACPNLENQDFANMQLCDIQEQIYHHEIVRRVETLEYIPATKQQAKLLELPVGGPLLLFENLVYSNEYGASAIEVSRVYFCANMIKLRMEYSKYN